MNKNREIQIDLVYELQSIDADSIGHNGCTLVPDFEFIEKRNLKEACNRHDIRYGLIKELRRYADAQLKKDIQSCGWKFVDDIYYHGVRIFGRLFS